MGLEAATFINDLVTSNPTGADGKSQGDDHLRLIKAVLQGTFPLAIGARKFRNDDAGATDTLTWLLYRKSASPGVNDLLGSFAVSGDSSTGVERVYARWQARIDDPVNATEDGAWLAKVMVAGAETQVGELTGAGIVDEADMFIMVAANQDYTLVQDAKFAFTITEVTTQCSSGTCTLTGKINAVALGGTANAVSSGEQTQAHSSANAVAVGNKVVLTVSANAACLNIGVTVKRKRISWSN